jgi:NAD+--dinitrogen-reductase ADP-D-ribosyltransferase
MNERIIGLYNTNALEAQLDLLYAYCQYELATQYPARTYIRLFRGVNRVEQYEVLDGNLRQRSIVVLNNLNSFSASRERAGEFGDYLIETDVPLSKIFFYCGLLPAILGEENEHVVIGGVYSVACSCY